MDVPLHVLWAVANEPSDLDIGELLPAAAPGGERLLGDGELAGHLFGGQQWIRGVERSIHRAQDGATCRGALANPVLSKARACMRCASTGATFRARMDKNRTHQDPGWTVVIGVVLTVAVFGALALGAAGQWGWFATFLSGAAASWVQAIGAVVAIVAAYKMGRGQIEADRALEADRRAKDDQRKLAAIGAFLFRLEAALGVVRRSAESESLPAFAKAVRDEISDAADGIRSIDLFQCPSPDAILFISLLPRHCGALVASLSKYDKADDELRGDVDAEFRRVKNALSLCEKTLAAAKSACDRAMAAVS